MNNIRLFITSDTHLEYYNDDQAFEEIIPDIDLLNDDKINIFVLAGDIGDPDTPLYRYFIKTVSSIFDYVIVILGNHESYHSSISYAEDKVREICEDYECIFLEKDYVIVEGIKFIGTTLWTNLTTDVYEKINKRYIKGYLSIEEFKNDNFDYSSVLFKENLEYIKQELDMPSVIITHHAPSRIMNNLNRSRTQKITPVYCNDLDDMFHYPILMWISGHTHSAKIVEYGETTLVSNPFGLSNEKTGYDRNLYFDL